MDFMVKPHTERPEEWMVEVWDGGQFIGGIYPNYPPDDGIGIVVVSNHLDGVRHVPTAPGMPPAVLVQFTDPTGSK